MREFASFDAAEQRYIKRSLDTLPVMAASIDDPLAERETVGLEHPTMMPSTPVKPAGFAHSAATVKDTPCTLRPGPEWCVCVCVLYIDGS